MPADNTQIVRWTFEAICDEDIDRLLEFYDDEIEFLPLTGTLVESGGYAGHRGVRDYFEECAEVWELMQPHADDLRTVGDDVVVLGGCAVRGRGSGAGSDNPMAWVITLRDGRVIRHRGFATREEALDAVGLTE
jgi:ketosteroid isomerase-like protein